MSAPCAVLINGRASGDWPVTDRGLHYADGLFETLTCVRGRPRWLADHWRRLLRGCTVLGLPAPDLPRLEAEIAHLAGERAACVVKLIYSRAGGERGYGYHRDQPAHRALLCYDWDGPPPAALPDASGPTLHAALAGMTLSEQPSLAGLKHLARLEQVLAAAERQARGVDELLLGTASGLLVCACSANVFVRLRGVWVTPDLATSGIAGVMRTQVLRASSALGIACEVREMKLAELAGAEALFVCNVRLGLRSLSHWERRALELDASVARMQDWIHAQAN